jgi:hypothetical protein
VFQNRIKALTTERKTAKSKLPEEIREISSLLLE